MRRDDRDDPFDDIFNEIERMMDGMGGHINAADAGFGDDAHISVYEADEEIRVVADLPGVDRESLRIKCDGRHVTISASTSASEYEERIELPGRVDEHSASASFNNGVLEIRLDRVDSSANIDLS